MAVLQPLGKSAENTKNSKLTELLNSLGLEAYFERPIKSVHSIDKPDVQIVHDGYYFVESKQTPATMSDAIAKAYKYKESISKIVEPKAVFGVLYPEITGKYEICALLNYEPFTIRNKVNSLEETAKWISNFIKNPPKRREPDANVTISTLREAVSTLSNALQILNEKDIEDIFGGKNVFENILDYKEDKYPTNQMRQAAAFLLMNQLLFYRILSRENPEYPDINDDLIQNPHDLLLYFTKVLEKDYAVTFGFDIASKIPKDYVEHVKATIRVIKALTPKKLPHDLVGKIFHDLIPLELRKSVAAYYTNNEAAELLAALAIENPDDKVIDFACGSGTLLVASYHRKRDLIRKKRNFTKDLHVKFLESDITGIDIMPFAAHLAAVHLSLQAQLYESEKVRIAIWDSTSLTPNKIIPALSAELTEAYKNPKITMFLEKNRPKKYLTKGGIALNKHGKSEIPLTKVDVVIMNPPFTRQERLPNSYKQKLLIRFKDYEKYLHGQLGLHGYFIFLADRFLNEGGRLAFVMPATTLRLKSFDGVKELLNKRYNIKYIIISGQRAAFSESTQFREILLIAEKVNKHDTKSKTVIVTMNGLPKSASDAVKIVTDIRNKKKVNPAYSLTEDYQENILNNINTYLGSEGAETQEIMKEYFEKIGDKIQELTQIIDKKSFQSGLHMWKGDKPYAAKMFILHNLKRAKKEQDEWYLEHEDKISILARNRITNEKITIPKKILVFGLRRFSGINKINISDEMDYLIRNEFDSLNKFVTGISKADLEKWGKNIDGKMCKCAVIGRFDISATGSNILAFYSDHQMAPTQMFWCIKDLKEEDAKIFSLWWNSSLNIMQILSHKKETRGAFMQLLAYSMKSFKVLDFRKLSKSQKEELLDVFDRVSKKEFPSILEQFKTCNTLRVEIDKTIFKTLGIAITDNELKNMYSAIVKDIEQLKNVMR